MELKGTFQSWMREIIKPQRPLKKGIHPMKVLSTARAFVEQQQYIFDTLWHKAIPAKQRIKEIEHGLKREFMDTMQDPYETQKILDNLLKSATEEILIILPTTTTNNILYQYEQEYLLTLLKNAAVDQGVRIRILVNESIKERIEREIFTRSSSDLIEIQLLDRQQQNKVITVIVDKELCLTAEVKDDDNYDSAVEVLGLATYSNSESTVLSFASIFETLWLQAELKNEQKKAARIT
jgi:SNF2 family DNA or RNA helicase